jgi:hypothetical protein
MDSDDIIGYATRLDGVIALRPQPGDGSPEISWGDVFFYYAPDGQIPPTQPFATIVTKDYPDEPASGLDEPGTFRLNIAAPAVEFARVLGSSPHDAVRVDYDTHARDSWFPHPVYGGAGWLSVVNPDTQRAEAVNLLDTAHRAARARYDRRRSNRDAD